MAPAILPAMAIGTGMNVLGGLQQGAEEQRIGEERARIDEQNAEAARRASVVEAEIRAERGRHFIEKQKGAAAAGGVRLNVGAPLVIAAQTKADITKDIGFGLERGREKEKFYRSRADIERRTGKARRRQSIWSSISSGFGGIADIGLKGRDIGWW